MTTNRKRKKLPDNSFAEDILRCSKFDLDLNELECRYAAACISMFL